MVKYSFVLSGPIFCVILMFVLDCCPGGRSNTAHYKISKQRHSDLDFLSVGI